LPQLPWKQKRGDLKNCEVWSEFNIACTLITMATVAILNFFQPQKLPQTTVDIPTKVHEV
jgi:hypothetical protein